MSNNVQQIFQLLILMGKLNICLYMSMSITMIVSCPGPSTKYDGPPTNYKSHHTPPTKAKTKKKQMNNPIRCGVEKGGDFIPLSSPPLSLWPTFVKANVPVPHWLILIVQEFLFPLLTRVQGDGRDFHMVRYYIVRMILTIRERISIPTNQ
jgi:hypothetical protein